MLQRQAVLLRHEQPGNPHYDLMIEDPAAPPGEGALITWRVDRPASEWAAAGKLPLHPLPDHRRAYLTREGPISGGRGHVRRVDAGTAIVRLWAADRAVLDLRLHHFSGTAHLHRLTPDRWIARFDAAPVNR